jgi:hypothetical protein
MGPPWTAKLRLRQRLEGAVRGVGEPGLEHRQERGLERPSGILPADLVVQATAQAGCGAPDVELFRDLEGHPATDLHAEVDVQGVAAVESRLTPEEIREDDQGLNLPARAASVHDRIGRQPPGPASQPGVEGNGEGLGHRGIFLSGIRRARNRVHDGRDIVFGRKMPRSATEGKSGVDEESLQHERGGAATFVKFSLAPPFPVGRGLDK